MNSELKTKNSNLTQFKRFYSQYTYVFSFIALVIIATIFNDNFFTYANLSTLMLQSAIKGVIALGMTLVIISGQIDLSVGSMVALVSGLGVVVLNRSESAILMLLFCMVFGSILGLINGLLVTKGRIAPFLVTLATLSAYRSIIVQLGQGGPFHVGPAVYQQFRLIAAGNFLRIPNLAIIFVLITAVIA
ncbi:MAG TPA: ABC transporter permease, partial [Clostridiaceae bacterium]|nr:ABC transporter permease [Clostridiaceae bacterium]